VIFPSLFSRGRAFATPYIITSIMASTSSGCVGLPRPHDGALPTAADLTAHFSLYAPAGASHELTAPEARCGCEDCKRWAAHVKTGGPHGQPLYLVPTADLADGIARWLVKQQQDLGQPLVALEVGAGDGALAHTLRCALSRLQSGNNITIIATDSGARGLKTVEGAEPVLKLDASKAAATFSPHVVIVAFMPLGVDWTAAFRATPSVRSYLLLGETDDGCCGRPWSTWGYMCDGDDDARDVRVSSTSGSSDEDVDGDDEAEAKAGGGEEEEAKAGGGEEEEAKAGGGDDEAEAKAGGGEEEEARSASGAAEWQTCHPFVASARGLAACVPVRAASDPMGCGGVGANRACRGDMRAIARVLHRRVLVSASARKGGLLSTPRRCQEAPERVELTQESRVSTYRRTRHTRAAASHAASGPRARGSRGPGRSVLRDAVWQTHGKACKPAPPVHLCRMRFAGGARRPPLEEPHE
jgi:hypothetical protein